MERAKLKVLIAEMLLPDKIDCPFNTGMKVEQLRIVEVGLVVLDTKTNKRGFVSYN